MWRGRGGCGGICFWVGEKGVRKGGYELGWKEELEVWVEGRVLREGYGKRNERRVKGGDVW